MTLSRPSLVALAAALAASSGACVPKEDPVRPAASVRTATFAVG
jgi:hypothetical protein